MSARILALAGPLQGSVFPLEEGLSLGRDSCNALCIDDPSLSRSHCAFSKSRERFHIKDLGSRNGTFVNGVAIQERILEQGDEIKIGRCVFVFLDQGIPEPAENVVELEDSLPPAATTILKPGDSVYLKPCRSDDRTAHNLKVLLEIGRAVSTIRGLAAMSRELLRLIFEIIPAEHGAIVLASDGASCDQVFTGSRSPVSEQPIQIPRALIDQVYRDRLSILGEDNALAVPMIILDRVIGAIYLDTGAPRARFSQEHLDLLTAIGGIAAGAIESALRAGDLESENQRLRAEINIEHNIVGQSRQIKSVYDFIARVAPAGSTVLIGGESGTGKELVARALHRNSLRAAKPFIAINCAALTESLLESELFGHEKGAFTGAVAMKRGKIEEAQGGSLFLDEVSELAPQLQAKLLRVLQEREFERVGGTRPIKADIRLIAATNRNLAEQTTAGGFRQDLYYRLNVVSITMPPLRERREDIPMLADYFAEKHATKLQRKAVRFSREALACMKRYEWPGNVRELENAIERALVLGSGSVIVPEDLPEGVLDAVSPDVTDVAAARNYNQLVKEYKKQLVSKTLEQTGGNQVEAARRLGLHPNNFYRLVHNLGVQPSPSKSGGPSR